jgi:hypothetical protein
MVFARSIFSSLPDETYTFAPAATAKRRAIIATPPPIPVIRIFLPGFAFPLLTIVALQAVSPVKGRAAASIEDRCVGASSNSPASIVTVSPSVPRGFILVPPKMEYPLGLSGPSGSSFQPLPGLIMTRLPCHFLAEGEEPVEVTIPVPSARRGTPKVVPG